MTRFSRLLVGSLLLTLAGCQVDPFCLDCVDGRLDAGGLDSGDTGRRDGGDSSVRDGGDSGPSLGDADIDGWAPDGCSVGATEVCNVHDDDCDLLIDEGVDTTMDVDNCGSCGHRCTYAHAFADCRASVCSLTTCDVNYYDRDGDPSNGCESRCITTAPSDSLCDNRDNDCDGLVDEDFHLLTDPMNCGICGRSCRFAHAMSGCTAGVCAVSVCDPGFFDVDGVPLNGCEYACTPVGPETCNLRDDDCNGMVDDGDPGSGASCGVSTGICALGVEHCVAGTITCTGGVSPGVETCNGMDDDCDGTIDDGNPEGGRACGSAIGACVPGRETCTAGALVCMGATGPATETCNGIDDNCDGMADDGDPGGGATCGTDVGSCTAGTVHCSGGGLACEGAVGPTLDLCNGLDDDCDGTADQTFNLMTDPRNCGMCGRMCSFPNAIAGCSASSCTLVACRTGFFNNDGDPTNGCEYACTRVSATESCNGVDDNCDGRIDETLTPPTNFCNPNGVCRMTAATCAVPTGSPPGTPPTWVCNYPPATYEAIETRCDTLDNDCNGFVDEPFLTLGQACNNGELGICRRTGTIACMGTTAVSCTAPAVGMPGWRTEVCNNLDDDCDGTLDDGTPGTWAAVTPAAGPVFWMQSYEASHPDGTGAAQGFATHTVCSEAGRLPWTNVLPAEAATACASVGGTLCTEAQWQRGCQTAAACTWSYAAACTTYAPMTCNGNDYDSNTVLAGDQDALISTGALASCNVTWAGTQVFDMSGNAQEWTQPRGAPSSGINPIRGGSYNDAAGGLTCSFSFEVAADTIRLPNVGFRCCRATAP